MTAMTVFFPLDTARIRLQGEWMETVLQPALFLAVKFVFSVFTDRLLRCARLCCCVLVDDSRKSQSTPVILAEIAKEEGV